MSGAFFEYPGVRFLRRFRLFAAVVRPFVFLLFRRLTHAARHSFRSRSRRHVAEFPAATQTAFERLKWTLRGSRAADRASRGALRPNDNSVNIEDHYDNSFIRERLAASTRRRLPQKGRRRSSLPAEEQHAKSAGQEIALGKNHGIFHERKRSRSYETGRDSAQWRGRSTAATVAQA